MAKFMKVKGKKGILVGHPSGIPGRYAGQRRKVFKDGELPSSLRDRYEPCEEVLPVSNSLKRAVRKEHLDWDGEVLSGKSAADAVPKRPVKKEIE